MLALQRKDAGQELCTNHGCVLNVNQYSTPASAAITAEKNIVVKQQVQDACLLLCLDNGCCKQGTKAHVLLAAFCIR
jgi:hypothetical protein